MADRTNDAFYALVGQMTHFVSVGQTVGRTVGQTRVIGFYDKSSNGFQGFSYKNVSKKLKD